MTSLIVKSIFLVTVLTVVTSGCSKTESKPSYLFKAAPKEGLAAKVGDIKITNQELEKGIQSDIYEAESKLFELKFNKLKSLLLEKFINQDPRKKDLSNDEFLEKFITSNVKITDSQIEKFIKDQNIPKEHLNPQVKEKIKNYLTMQEKKGSVDKWLGEKLKKSAVEVYIPKPQRPVFDVKVDGTSPYFGSENAKVTIVEYSDFQCPFCAKGADILKQLKTKYGKKIKIVFKNFPLPFHNQAEKAAVAGLCAHKEGNDSFWKMHDKMFAQQDQLSSEGLKTMAKNIGLNEQAFEKCLEDEEILKKVKKDMQEGKEIGVKSTPTFYVNGRLINGAQSIDVFSELIDEQLAL